MRRDADNAKTRFRRQYTYMSLSGLRSLAHELRADVRNVAISLADLERDYNRERGSTSRIEAFARLDNALPAIQQGFDDVMAQCENALFLMDLIEQEREVQC